MPIRASDIFDSDFVEPNELASDGYTVYLPNIGVVSTTSGSHTVVISPIPDGEGLTTPAFDHPVGVGDIVYLYNTSGADGYYTIASIVNDTTLTVVESINSSTGGFVDFIWPVGASGVGVNPARISGVTSTNLQGALEEIAFTASSAMTPFEHETLRQLIHFLDSGGPGDGFTSGAYREILPLGNPFPTSVTWYTDSTKTQKIVEKLITLSGIVPTSITWNMYGTNGITIVESLTDTIFYINNVFESHRVRTINI
jgi:hypothetical protein